MAKEGSRFAQPIKKETESELIKTLIEQIGLEKSVELAKNAVINCPDFNVHDAFRIFNPACCGGVSVRDF